MKEIAPTFASLKKNLDSNSADAAAQDAAKLEELFKETEAFWAQFNTKDAVDHAKNAQKAFAEISAKNQGQGHEGSTDRVRNYRKYLCSCHFSHREDTGKGFIIKP